MEWVAAWADPGREGGVAGRAGRTPPTGCTVTQAVEKVGVGGPPQGSGGARGFACR